MQFEEPSSQGYTIYSKSGCPNCVIAKKQAAETNTNETAIKMIECDDYLLESRPEFLSFIRVKMQQLDETKKLYFPFIFKDGHYIGSKIYNITGISTN